MATFFARHWKTLALTSVSLTSSYFFADKTHSPLNYRILSTFIVQAAEHEGRNTGKVFSKYHFSEHDDDDDEEDDDDKDENNLNKTDESITSNRERRFRDFASIEYNGEVYMTSVDFLESIISEQPRPRIGRRQLTDEMVNTILYNTPPKHRGSNRFFRNLEDSGLISYSEYLFLWVVLTKPVAQFEIAFAMFDTDGNQLVDKHEFLVLGKAMADKRMHRRQLAKHAPSKSHSHFNFHKYFKLTSLMKRLFLNTKHSNKILPKQGYTIFDYHESTDTTLLWHFFGRNGRNTLNYTEFKRFMENFQMEILEIEFSQFSHGFKTISDLDFAEILLRYTDFDHSTKKSILKRVKKSSDEPHAITFEQFKHFFTFLNNLEEFSVAMRFHQLSNKPITQAEFQRAAKISTGFELESHVVGLIFRIFDADDDQHLSYDEFMAVMKDRLSRGFQSSDASEISNSRFNQFKRCLRDRAKYDAKLALK